MSFYNNILLSIITLVPLLITIAFFTLAERKIMASIQRRKGPNITGYFGLLQPFADGFKLIIKEIILPYKINKIFFVFAPIYVLFLSFINWVFLPFSIHSIFIDNTYSLLLLLIISSLNVYGIFLAGWSSNSKYALLGSIRAIAQMISYEIGLVLSILPIALISNSYNLIIIVNKQSHIWNIFLFIPIAIIFSITILAETNRAPFDLAEAEAELVAGYNIEYASIIFVSFFLAEYSNILIMSYVFSLLFLGGWSSNLSIFLSPLIFSIKVVIISFLFIFIRSNLPRYRFDQLMYIGWKVIIPMSFGLFIFYINIFYSFNLSHFIELPFVINSNMYTN